MDCSMPGFPLLHYLLEFAQAHVHWAYNAIQPSYPLSLLSNSVFNLSKDQGLFSISQLLASGGQIIGASSSVGPSNEYSGLISFRIDWFDLLAFQGVIKSIFQHHSPKASILQLSAFFMIQLLHPYVTCGKTIGKTIALTIQTFVAKRCLCLLLHCPGLS